MTTSNLRDLFEIAVHDEPASPPIHVQVDADVARGRRRRRVVRARAAVGVGALAASAVVAVPAVLPSDRPSDTGVATEISTSDGRGTLSPEVAEDELLRDMWRAVDDALPDDVTLQHDSYVYASSARGLYLSLNRDDAWFSVAIEVQEARPDLEPFDPCSDPHPAQTEWFTGATCSATEDDEGRWQVVAIQKELEQFPDDVVILEGGAASVTTTWGSAVPVDQMAGEEAGDDVELQRGLTRDEALSVTEAVWEVAAERPAAELTSGIDLNGYLALRPQLVESIGAALWLGPLTVAADRTGDVDDPAAGEHRSFSSVLRLTGTNGEIVDVEVWQKDRLYDVHCSAATNDCSVMPGHVVSGAAPGEPIVISDGAATMALGQRGGIDIAVRGVDDTVAGRLAAALDEIAQVIPYVNGVVPGQG